MKADGKGTGSNCFGAVLYLLGCLEKDRSVYPFTQDQLTLFLDNMGYSQPRVYDQKEFRDYVPGPLDVIAFPNLYSKEKLINHITLVDPFNTYLLNDREVEGARLRRIGLDEVWERYSNADQKIVVYKSTSAHSI